MDEHFEKVMDLASQGRFEEARKYIQEADITANQKARYNMSLWRMENNSMKYTPAQPDIPKLPVVSMILGFVLIIAGFFLSGSAQSFIIITGLIMAAAVPAFFVLKEKKHNGTETVTRTELAKKYTDAEADMNFPWQVPRPAVIITTILGIGLLTAAAFIYGNSSGDINVITALILLTAGFAVMTLSRIQSDSFNGALMWGTMAVSALFLTATAVSAMLLEGKAALTAAFAIAGSAALLLYPLWFVLIKKAVCSDTAEAECVDVQTTLGYKDYHPRYRAIWMYEYNGTTYLHRDMTSYKSPVYNERKTIRLSPRYPHNIYTGKLPVSAFFISAAGFFFLAFLLLFLQPLM